MKSFKRKDADGDAEGLEERQRNQTAAWGGTAELQHVQHAFSTRGVVKFEEKAGDIDF